MFTTTLTFNSLINWFKNSEFKYLFLFVCGYDTNPDIVESIIHNQSDIDFLTGKDIAYIYFERDNVGIMSWGVRSVANYNIPKESIRLNYAVSEEVCDYFGISRYMLPALLVVSKDGTYDLFPVKSSHELNLYLQPIGIITSFKKDIQSIERNITRIKDLPNILKIYYETLEQKQKRLSYIEKHYNVFVTDSSIAERIEKNYKTLFAELKLKGIKQNVFESVFENGAYHNLKTIQTKLLSLGLTSNYIPIIETIVMDINSVGNFEKFNSREGTVSLQVIKCFEKYQKEKKLIKEEILELNKKIQDCQQEVLMSEQILTRLDSQKREINEIYATKLRKSIFIPLKSDLLYELIDNRNIDIILLLKWVRDNGLNINAVIERLNILVEEGDFDLFISCKSQDYEAAEEVYSFLQENGYHPFLASKTLRELGSDNYGYIIRKIISRCKIMIVFASDISYLTTSYVSAEWNQYLDELSAGLNNGKLFSIVPSGTLACLLPSGLRTKQFFTIENYREQILSYLSDVTEKNCLQNKEAEEAPFLQQKNSFFQRIKKSLGIS